MYCIVLTQTKTFSVFYEEYVDGSSFRSIGSLFVFHARDAATEKALSLIRRHVRGMTRLPHNEARSPDRAGISVTGVSKSEMYSVQEATCELACTVCTGSSLWLVTSATLGEPESHGHRAWNPELSINCTTTTTTSNRFTALCQGLPGWAGTRRNIHPLTYPDHQPSSISFFHLPRSIASSLFNLRAWQSFLHNLSPCPLWSTSWSGALHLTFHTFLHPISVFFSQHMPIPAQPVLL